jgi:hypothetical protein
MAAARVGTGAGTGAVSAGMGAAGASMGVAGAGMGAADAAGAGMGAAGASMGVAGAGMGAAGAGMGAGGRGTTIAGTVIGLAAREGGGDGELDKVDADVEAVGISLLGGVSSRTPWSARDCRSPVATIFMSIEAGNIIAGFTKYMVAEMDH